MELLALNDSGNIFIDSSTETLHMQNGTYIPTSDLSTYITRNAAVGGIGTDGDDDFVQIPTGDQRLVGGAGNDRVFLHGNVRDYSFEMVDEAATGTTPAVQGIELHALNHSGDLYIDSSIETVHFLDGLTSSYVGLQSFLPAQIAG